MWPAIIALLIDRAAAGFPILSELLRRRKAELVQLAGEVEPADGPARVGAAPAEVKDLVIQFVQRMQVRASSTVLRTALGLLLLVLPQLADQAWDAIARVLNGGDAPPTPVMAASTDPTAVALADACDAMSPAA
jgi:hypothetical protein